MKYHFGFLSAAPAIAVLTVALSLPAALSAGSLSADPPAQENPRSGQELYLAACANCHGPDGKGGSPSLLGFNFMIRDFTDCQATNREADADWISVGLKGGPAKGFSELMPAFEGVLTPQEVGRIVTHMRTFCPDRNWPRGELNLPRAMLTEKAFPEDEALITTSIDTEGDGRIANKFIYEQRLGARNQFEIVAPFGWQKTAADTQNPDWSSSLGDVAVGARRVFYHSYERGSIFSVTAELITPTGDEARGFGKGTFIFEPFLSFGQLLPAHFFFQVQTGVELPFQSQKAEKEGYLRLALGRGFDTGRWGRTWSPMVELAGAGELGGNAVFNWDVVPQFQVTLNKRKNIRANLGVQLPVNNTSGRYAKVVFYLLWDWFDGTLYQGW
jgi:mono/diheme cytochrome c family protein